MRFEPYPQTASIPNVIVDGPRNAATVLALSHWARSGTPQELKADTSTEIVFNYFDAPRFHVQVDAVSNNHFDEDGLLGIFALLDPAGGERYRDLLIDASRAGDFDVYRSRDAARIAFVLGAYADPVTSPLPARIFQLPHADQTAELYVHTLALLPSLLADPGDFRSLWEAEDATLTEHESLIDKGLITIEERPELDLAIVRAPENLGHCHRHAIHSRTERSRVATIHGNRIELHYRYEGWVQMASRRPLLRVDLAGLADELNLEQAAPGRWVLDDVESIIPRLRFEGGASSVSADDVLKRIEHHLRVGAPAWNPYD